MSGNNDPVDEKSRVVSGPDASRRSFLKGSGALAASTGLLGSDFAGMGAALDIDLIDADPDRTYDVHAIKLDVVFNNNGLHAPNWFMYVLEENLEDARAAAGEVPGESEVDTSVLEPLTIRANQGEVVAINFHNHLDREASMHQTGLPYDVETSDGMNAGRNPAMFGKTSVAPGESTTYTWYAQNEGTHFFTDGVNQSFFNAPNDQVGKVNSTARGLFGALVVESPGAEWVHPETGERGFGSGTRAIIEDSTEPDHREFTVFYHNAEGTALMGNEDLDQHVNAINYRADRTSERVDAANRPSKEFYSSWVHGDPGGGDNVFEAYTGDPIKMVAIGAQVEENHVHHLHGHRWKDRPTDVGDNTVDSKTVGSGATHEARLVVGYGEGTTRTGTGFQEAFEFGAGYAHGSTGDFLFHCHLFPHYAEGMNGMMRVFDATRDDLVTLANNPGPFEAEDGDADDGPGFPEFVPGNAGGDGELGDPAPLPPDRREPTADEQARGMPVKPGAPYTDPANVDDEIPYDPNAEPDQVYNVHALRTELVYNDAGDYDPGGIVFALEEDVADIKNGDLRPEPLVIRANLGDTVEITLTNETELPISMHPHFVGFDPLGSDSTMVGYNYDNGVDPGEQGTFRWYADEEGAIFVHDHMSGVGFGMHGSFATLIVEPKGSTWLDPYNGEEIRKGAKAMIVDADDPNVDDFRELALLYHDFVPMRDADGNLLTDQIQHGVNEGVMAINYRNAPYFRRLSDSQGRAEDQAYVHSSTRHGDPPTPVFESYPDDPVRIRLVQAAWEEQHNFTLHGLRPNPEGLGPRDSVSQVIGTSESFTFELPNGEEGSFQRQNNPDDVPVRDYLYGSMIEDDLWNGMWGLFRIWGSGVDHLQGLPDQGKPAGTVPESDLIKMGHPAPFEDPPRTEIGQRATLDNGDARSQGTGRVPPTATDPGNVTPDAGGRVRQYDVSAVSTRIQFNEYDDHDPLGIVFVPDEELGRNGRLQGDPRPLTIRANKGDVIELTLTNRLPKGLPATHNHAKVRGEDPEPLRRSNRVSLHPQQFQYDAQGSDGATVGFNYDQTIDPGKSITYRWKATAEGTSVLWGMADIRGHRHHGAYGQAIVEPSGSWWLNPENPDRSGTTLDDQQQRTGSEAIIKRPGGGEFREYGLLFSDGMYILNDDDKCVVPAPPEDEDKPCNQQGDTEDQGFGAINFRSEPFRHRFENDDTVHQVYNSEIHGDPNTDVLHAQTGDSVVFRVSQAGSKQRGIAFHLAGHPWREYPRFGGRSPLTGVDDTITPGRSVRVEPVGGAGGSSGESGDFVYQELKQAKRLEMGLWGLFRVRDSIDDLPVAPLEGN